MQLIFIVNGEDVIVETDEALPLSWAVRRALTQSQNLGRPVKDWEVRDCRGALLDTSRDVGDYQFDQTRESALFCNLGVGAGGSEAQVIAELKARSIASAREMRKDLVRMFTLPF